MWITIMQISQMVVGVIITVVGFVYAGPDCPGQKRPALYFQGIMYGSYLYLFLDFMVRRFVFKRGKGQFKEMEKEKAQ
jgi:elongation of very long chain fatty acids protein 6